MTDQRRHELTVPVLLLLTPIVGAPVSWVVAEWLHTPTGQLSDSLWFVWPMFLTGVLGIVCPLIALTLALGGPPTTARRVLIGGALLMLVAAALLLYPIFA